MRWPQMVSFFLTLLSFGLSAISASTATSSQNIDIFYWPLSASSPSQASRLAEISYDPAAFQPSVLSYTPPSPKKANDDLLRIGLFTDKAHKQWVGSLASFSAFSNSSITPSLSLYVSSDNEIYNVAISPSTSTVEEKRKQNLNVELVRSTPAPTPHLSRPVVLREDGKETEQVVEKTLMQNGGSEGR
ncbi:hypothetical protein PRK78_004895 [Emydomyces testavorans]|uniref:Uncharacterized protein n=1 Tax=Emydomyces testavorans TaxID=2070801 RepID=A0AAF0DJM0_9EURO|nr:hypothetical protein PRK78_004895 [Emydomyces testavorans]